MLPTVILPGYFAAASEYREFEAELARQVKAPVTTVPLQRRDWFVTLGGRPVTPILSQLDRTIKQVLQETQSDQINLIGHSAGGWISRIYLGGEFYCDRSWHGLPWVRTLITLGTPHTSQERWTRTNLEFVNQTYPGAFHDAVHYVCIAGKSIFGQKKSWRFRDWFTYQSYELTCGEGASWGDGVTPIQAAHLEGSTNLILEGVQHSPRPGKPGIQPEIQSGTNQLTPYQLTPYQPTPYQPTPYQWYGSASQIPAWSRYLA